MIHRLTRRLLAAGAAIAMTAAAAAGAAVGAAPAQAAGTSLSAGVSADVVRHGYVLPAAAHPEPAFFRSPSFLRRAGVIDSTSNPASYFVSKRKVVYQGGPILPVTNVHLIFWYGPPGGTAPRAIDTFALIMKKYVTQGNGKSLFKMLHQYFMINSDKTKTYPSATIKLAGTYTDSVTPFPSHCTHPITGTYCITDADIQGEIQQAITKKKWSYGIATHDVFIVFTMSSGAHTIGSCYTPACGPGQVSGQDWCAYHSYFPLNLDGTADPVIYAYVPYPLAVTGRSCDNLPSTPHGEPGIYDFYLNLMSHEHIEMITDPLPGAGTRAWMDLREQHTTGGEVADKCNFYFKPTYPGPGGTLYNQKWAPLKSPWPGGLYMLQDDFSNKALKATGSGCVQRAS
jgi:hypothetical protein